MTNSFKPNKKNFWKKLMFLKEFEKSIVYRFMYHIVLDFFMDFSFL